MKNNFIKILPAQIIEVRDALFKHELQVRIRLTDFDIWSVVHRTRINNGMLFLQVLRENDDYFDVVIPGEILRGSRVVRTTKTGNTEWFYQINQYAN